jgi:hypothetical protein
MSGYTVGWIGLFVWFFAEEGWALARHSKNGTLSAHFRMWFHTDRKAGRWAFIVAFGVFAAWFCPHIIH